MPESPDFESIARHLIVLIDPDCAEEDENPIDDLHCQAIANQLTAVAEQLRLVWNARGAADIATIESVLYMEASAPYVKTLDVALRKLDR